MEGISQGMPSFFALLLGRWDLQVTYMGGKEVIFEQIFWRNQGFWLFLQKKMYKTNYGISRISITFIFRSLYKRF